MTIEELLKKHGEEGTPVSGDIENYLELVCSTHNYSYGGAATVKDSKDSHYVVRIFGGNNGQPKWKDYFLSLADVIDHFQQDGYKVWCIRLTNDCLDDVHEVFMGLRML